MLIKALLSSKQIPVPKEYKKINKTSEVKQNIFSSRKKLANSQCNYVGNGFVRLLDNYKIKVIVKGTVSKLLKFKPPGFLLGPFKRYHFQGNLILCGTPFKV